jgi:hypothetical protein
MMPVSAPWRSSPDSSRRRKVCSVSVAAANSPATRSARRAWDPLPDTAPISEKAALTSVTVNIGCAAGGGNERKTAQPTPIWRCGSSPDSQETTIATKVGSGVARFSSSAMRTTLARRADAPATSNDVAATSISSTTQLYTAGDNC